MSCLCEKYNAKGEAQGCICDQFIHPQALRIPAGLKRLPRQIATFPQFRQAMLADIIRQDEEGNNPLEEWRARDKEDLGIMLLEMWAYVCDNLSFYDEVIAHEAYLKTARRRPSVRRLVDLLGYLPVPAVAASANLATFADGRKAVKLPIGTAFRSKGFDDEAPQVFELTKEATIHPLNNEWNIEAPHPGVILKANPKSLLVQLEAEIVEGTALLIIDTKNASQSQTARVAAVKPYVGQDEENYTKVIFRKKLKLAVGTALTDLKIFVPTQTAAFYTINDKDNSISSNGRVLTLDKQYRQLHGGDYILINRRKETRWFELTSVKETMRTPNSNNTIVINKSTFQLTPIKIPVSQVKLDKGLNNASRKKSSAANWTNDQLSELTIHFNMTKAGTLVDEAKTTLNATDPLLFTGIIETPKADYHAEHFLLQDKNLEGVSIKGKVNYPKKKLNLGQGEEEHWENPLTLPVEAFGNVVEVQRGESVDAEILGSGDASSASQAFQLKKKPLTYLHAPTAENDQGVINTLKVYVNGIQWKEIASFFGMESQDQVYIVRQDDEGETIITFGDGERGQRIPTGSDNILAWYRFGAGAASPPADSITQIAKPAEGLRSVKNPLAAFGGADKESAEEICSYAPRSILTLGRAVSILDMEAIALTVPGVRVVQSEWRWDGLKQKPVIKIWYIGEKNIEEKISKRLRNVSDPSTAFEVIEADAYIAHLAIDIEIDPRYLEENVVTELFDLLLASKDGLLIPEQLKVGKPLFRSRLFEAMLRVEGVKGVRAIQWGKQIFEEYAKTPGVGKYFDFENGTILINGKSKEQ